MNNAFDVNDLNGISINIYVMYCFQIPIQIAFGHKAFLF